MKFRTLWLVALLAIGVLALTGCNKNNTPAENPNPEGNVEETVVKNTEENVEEVAVENTEENVEEIVNPAASVYCEENGGTVMPREDGEGNQVTLCVFDNGIACEEWAFYRGECQA